MDGEDIHLMKPQALAWCAGFLLTVIGCTALDNKRPLTPQEQTTYLRSNQQTLIADQSLSDTYSVLLSRNTTATEAWCEVLTAQPQPTLVGTMGTDGLVGQAPTETPISVIPFWYAGSEVTCIWINDPMLQQAGTEIHLTYRDGIGDRQPLATSDGHIFVRDGVAGGYQQVQLYDQNGHLLHEVLR